MSTVRVTRRIAVPAAEGSTPWLNVSYTARTGRSLMEISCAVVASDTQGDTFVRRSEDNGRRWSDPVQVFRPQTTPQGTHRLGEFCLFLDEEKDALLQFCNDSLYPADTYTGDSLKLTRIAWAMSRDGGRAFPPLQPLIQRGHDETHWADDVAFGRNCAAVSFCAPAKRSDGRILLPVQRCPLDSDFNRNMQIKWEALCFIGEWKGDRVEWTLSQPVRLDAAKSSRGICEAAIAELAGGRLLMICRASNARMPNVAGRKWRALSEDGGLTWSAPEPLTYETGETFFSPATGSRLIRHSRTGRLYWIGNITPENPDGNRPRYPLQIAEVDESRPALKKGSVHIIEDRQPNDPPWVQFSNFRVYEDRETGEFVLHMARIQERQKDPQGLDLTSPSYEYRILVEAG